MGSQPPKILPTADMVYTAATGSAMAVPLIWYWLSKKSGNQKR